jgi:GNAT superfamily N-acetyltransferase
VQYQIRPYRAADRQALREICCRTAFLEIALEKPLVDNDVLADALCRYFTDYEPQSCFAAVYGDRIVGYIIGTLDCCLMSRVFNSKILLPLLGKACVRRVFLRPQSLRFIFYLLRSLLRGEFNMPDFSADFPAGLHINILRGHRGHGLGRALVERYLDYLRQNQVKGVHFGTFSAEGAAFFRRLGFQELFRSRRSYLKRYVNREVDFYIFAMRLEDAG